MSAMVARLDNVTRGATPVADCAFAACLEPLLGGFRWRGSPRQLAEAVTSHGCMDLLDFRNAMANLDFASRVEKARLKDIDCRLLPCVFVPDDGGPMVVLEAGRTPDTLVCFEGASAKIATTDALDRRGSVCFFTLDEARTDASPSQKGGWLKSVRRRFEGTFVLLLVLSFFLSLLALLPAFFVQAVYDRVLATHEHATLVFLAVGVLLALVCDTALRAVRGAILAHLGARLDFLIGTSIIRKLLSLPLARLEKTTIGSQIARLQQFEGLRSAFTGPMALALLELPFVFVFVIAIAGIGGWLALVPIGLALIIASLGVLAIRYARDASGRAVGSHGDHQSLLIEILSNMPAIKASAAEAIWLERFRERSAEIALVNLGYARIAALTENIAQAVNLVAGASTLAIGALLALDGSLSVGALIASMTLVWRMLAPFQALFVTLTKVQDIGSAVRGVNQAMLLPSEGSIAEGRPRPTRGRRFAGRITFQRVVLRYAAHHEPAIGGISFDIKPGQVVAVTGGNGCGKSSVLKLVAGVYQPQIGAVLIDGVDSRHINPINLRQSVAYLPQQSDLFTGTLADNLRLASPTATDDELRAAAAKAGLLAEIDALPAGFGAPADQLSASFARRLVLARTCLIDASIILLDEPGVFLDAAGEDLLLAQLDALRGRSTVLLVTHHPAHVRAADRVIVLRHGTIVHDGSPQELMTKLAGDAR
ncbi:ATP-binding cassette subfamily C protein LapB [Nitrobacteraceae bacterium AZCC 2146]